jgi:outer membrane receptor protein involved in Fe transport
MLATAQVSNSKPAPFSISGHVADSVKGLDPGFATISLHQQGNKSIQKSVVADSAGKFVIERLAAGKYSVTMQFTGYAAVTRGNIRVDNEHPSVDLATIYLASNEKTLQSVTITAGPKLIENKIDKLVYNAEKDISSQTGVATDILKKVPQVSVDINGNVELAGNSGIRFLINGKPSTAFGSNITDVLQSIPASQIKSIEVVTNPGAKYDAQGTAGVINIILKKSMVRGINGNIALSAGTRSDNGSFNFNARRGKLGINTFVSGNYRPAANSLYTLDRVTFDTAASKKESLHQEGTSFGTRKGIQYGAGFDWTYKEKNNFSGSFSINRFQNEGSNGSVQYQKQVNEEDGSLIGERHFTSTTNNHFTFSNLNVSLNYKRTFKKEGEELEVSYYSGLTDNEPVSDNVQVLLPTKDAFYGNKNQNIGRDKQSEIKIDYSYPVSDKIKFDAGGKYSFSGVNSNATVYSLDANSNPYYFNDYLSNALDYKQKVYAVYSEISFPVKKIIDVKLGGRYERTELDSYFSNAQQQAETPGYNTFVPTIYLARKITDNQQLRLNYSKRIERPGYWDLNPFVNTNDPKNLSTGNPYLLPEIARRVELSYNLNKTGLGYFMAGIFYRKSEQDAQTFIRYYPSFEVGDTTYHDVSVMKPENIGTENNAGVNLYGDVHVTEAFTVRTNASFFYRYTINELNPGYNSSSMNYRLNANASYKFNATLMAEFFGNFNSPRNEAQGKYPSFTTYSFGIRKQILNKKGSVSLTAQNPFSNYVGQETSVFGPNFTGTSFRKVPFRSFGINFTWKFGKLEFKKEREETSPNLGPEG